MQEVQDYHPYRGILSREELRALSKLRPAIIVRDTIVDWAVILATWGAVAIYPSIWMALAAIPIIGTRYYALLIIGHDGLHRRLFDENRLNDLWNDVFLVGPIGAITRINRANHIQHHRITARPDDPDRHKYVHDNKEPILPFLFFVSGLANIKRTLVNVFVKPIQPRGEQNSAAGYGARDLAILVGWQVLLIGGLTWAIGWWAYFVLWLLPVYLFAYRGDLVRVFCEHAMLMSDSEADAHRRMVTYDSNWLERQFFAPHNMNYHISHHLWPGIPYYNLPAAEQKVRSWAAEHGTGGDMVWRKSYCGFLLSYWRWRWHIEEVSHTTSAQGTHA